MRSLARLTVILATATVAACGGTTSPPATQPAPVQDAQPEVSYFLPKSVLVVTAKVTSKFDFGKRARVERVSDVATSLEVVADSGALIKLDLNHRRLSNQELKVEFTSQGLVSSVNAVSTGQLGVVAKNVFGLAVSAARILGVGFSATPAETLYLTEQTGAATSRVRVKATIATLLGKQLDLSERLITAANAVAEERLSAQIKRVQAQIVNLRAEEKLADQAFLAWKNRKEAPKVEPVRFILEMSDLPTEATMKGLPAKPSNAQLQAAMPAASWRLWERLGLAVVVSDPPTNLAAPVGNVASKGMYRGIYFRRGRPVRLTLHKKRGQGDGPTLVALSATTEVVQDGYSPVTFLAFGDSVWSKSSLTAAFGANGALTKLGNDSESEMARATEALRALPAEYLSAIKQSNEITTENQKAMTLALQGQIDSFTQRRELLEAEMSYSGANEASVRRAEIDKINSEVALLEAQIKLAGVQGSADSLDQRASLELEQQILQLRNEVAKAEIERLKLEAELAKLRDAGDDG